ncbi:MAG: ABC transporter permease [Thermoleophilia bacterium]|nr:ABC transporter permease [Thermoleophilia bacterium]
MEPQAGAILVEPPERTLGRRLRGRAADWGPALGVFVLGLALWEGLVQGLDVERFLLPPPSEILETLRENWGPLSGAAWFTFQEALGGFAIGSAAGIAVALVLARWRRVGRAIMPYAIAANAVPIIAFAPITNNWFGVTNKSSKMAIAAVLVFFPVLVNTLRGLTSVRPASIELMRSYAAGELDVFRRVRIPNALPFVFTGLKVATVLAMIGAIVGDYFGGSQDSLGIQIRRSAGIFAFTHAWAAIVLASALGIAFYAAVAVAERLTMRRYPSARRAD